MGKSEPKSASNQAVACSGRDDDKLLLPIQTHGLQNRKLVIGLSTHWLLGKATRTVRRLLDVT